MLYECFIIQKFVKEKLWCYKDIYYILNLKFDVKLVFKLKNILSVVLCKNTEIYIGLGFGYILDIYYANLKFIMNLIKILTRQMTHLWPDARCIHWKRTTNIVLKINSIFEHGS